MKQKLILAALGALSVTLIACQADRAQPKTASTTAAASTVHTLKLPEFDAVLPPGKGLEAVQLQCAVCHTPHYILNQPPLSRETWTAEVTKMQKVYSAPIPAEKVPEIVDYLVAVRGPAQN